MLQTPKLMEQQTSSAKTLNVNPTEDSQQATNGVSGATKTHFPPNKQTSSSAVGGNDCAQSTQAIKESSKKLGDANESQDRQWTGDQPLPNDKTLTSSGVQEESEQKAEHFSVKDKNSSTDRSPPDGENQADAKKKKPRHVIIIDPREAYRRAKKAQEMAKKLAQSAKKYADAPARLSGEFIAGNFPYDTTDGHYAACVVCGLTGDLLCCDGCANVVHIRKDCLGADDVPDGDWFCGHCLETRKWTDGRDEDEEKKTAVDAPQRVEHSKWPAVIGGTTPKVTKRPANASTDGKDEAPARAKDSKVAVATASERSPKNAEAADASTQSPNTTISAGNNADGTNHEIRNTESFAAVDKDARSEQPKVYGKKWKNPSAVVPNHTVHIPKGVFFETEEQQCRFVESELNELFKARTGKDKVLTRGPKKSNKKENDDDEEEEEEEDDKEVRVGSLFLKKFGRHGYFQGEVKALPTEEKPFYRVVYEDCDEEDLSATQLGQLMYSEASKKMRRKNKKGKAKKTKSSDKTQASKKRKIGEHAEEPKVVYKEDDFELSDDEAPPPKRQRGSPKKRAAPPPSKKRIVPMVGGVKIGFDVGSKVQTKGTVNLRRGVILRPAKNGKKGHWDVEFVSANGKKKVEHMTRWMLVNPDEDFDDFMDKALGRGGSKKPLKEAKVSPKPAQEKTPTSKSQEKAAKEHEEEAGTSSRGRKRRKPVYYSRAK